MRPEGVRLMPGSLRARVTLVCGLGAAGALAICLAVLYVSLDRQLWAALDSGLGSRSGDLAAAVRAGDLVELSYDPIAQLYNADGALIAGSGTLRDRLLDRKSVV